MYLEFILPDSHAYFVNRHLDRELDAWSQRYQISYRTKTVKYRKRVTFDQDSAYEFFLLTWQPKVMKTAEHSYRPRLIMDLNNR